MGGLFLLTVQESGGGEKITKSGRTIDPTSDFDDQN